MEYVIAYVAISMIITVTNLVRIHVMRKRNRQENDYSMGSVAIIVVSLIVSPITWPVTLLLIYSGKNDAFILKNIFYLLETILESVVNLFKRN